LFFFFNDTATTEIYTLSLHDALPISSACQHSSVEVRPTIPVCTLAGSVGLYVRLGLPGASNPWRSHATRRIPRGLMVVVQVPSREYAPTLRLDV